MAQGNNEIRIAPLTLAQRELIIPAYSSVFQDHPWHEEFECKNCGSGPYSQPCNRMPDGQECPEFKSGKLFSILETSCRGCGVNLASVLKPIYTPEGVAEDFEIALSKPGFMGSCALTEGGLVAFCWGYDFPLDHPRRTGSTWYAEAAESLRAKQISPEECFYHNESGTIFEFRGKGLGTRVLKDMLSRSKSNQRRFVVYRTINPVMNRCYEKLFGIPTSSLTPIFQDPNPDKRQLWYALDLAKGK